MEKIKGYLLICVILILSPHASLKGQSDSLNRYMELAVNQNPLLKQKFATYLAALKKIPQVGSLPDPELSAGIFLSPMELISGRQVADLRLMQMFPWFGVQKNARDEMSLMAQSQFENFRSAKLEVAFEIKRSWNELQRISQLIKINQQIREQMLQIERLTLARIESGSGSEIGKGESAMKRVPPDGNSGKLGMGMGNSDLAGKGENIQSPSSPMGSKGSGLESLLRLQLDRNSIENRIDQLKSRLASEQVRFNTLLNRPAEDQIVLPETLKVDSLLLNLDEVTDTILQHSPMVGMLKNEQAAYQARERMVRRMGYPMIGLGINYSLIQPSPISNNEMNGRDMVMPMVTLTLPIHRAKYRAMYDEAKALKESSEWGISSAINSLRVDFKEAVREYKDAQQSKIFNQKQLELTRSLYRIAVQKLGSSAGELDELIKLNQQLLELEVSLLEAKVAGNLAIARLIFLINSKPI